MEKIRIRDKHAGSATSQDVLGQPGPCGALFQYRTGTVRYLCGGSKPALAIITVCYLAAVVKIKNKKLTDLRKTGNSSYFRIPFRSPLASQKANSHLRLSSSMGITYRLAILLICHRFYLIAPDSRLEPAHTLGRYLKKQPPHYSVLVT
jgi:hypothetical protein